MTHRHCSRHILPLLAVILLIVVAPIGVPLRADSTLVEATDQSAESVRAATTFSVIVPVQPYGLVVDRISEGRVDVHILVPPGQSPHTYSPAPQQIAAFAEADALFHVGLELEHGLVPKLQELNEDLLIIQLTSTEPGSQDAGEHIHDHESGHDPHVWLNPDSVARQAALIAEALALLDPAGAPSYAARCESLVRDLSSLDKELRSRLEPHAGTRFYVFHPAFGHFAEAYDLKQVAIEADGKEPGAKRLAELMDMARGENVRVVITQPQHSDATVRTLAGEIDAKIVSVDPLAYDLFATLRALADAIAGDTRQETEDDRP